MHDHFDRFSFRKSRFTWRFLSRRNPKKEFFISFEASSCRLENGVIIIFNLMMGMSISCVMDVEVLTNLQFNLKRRWNKSFRLVTLLVSLIVMIYNLESLYSTVILLDITSKTLIFSCDKHSLVVYNRASVFHSSVWAGSKNSQRP